MKETAERGLRGHLERVWRQKLWIVIPVVLCGCAAFFGSGLLPKRYRASTLILVESQKVPSDYIKTTITTSLEERLRTLEQQIKSRNNLESVIAEIKPFGELVSERQVEWAVNEVRHSLTIISQGAAFELLLTGSDPDMVAALLNRLADLFIERNLQLRGNQAQGTTEFLETEMLATRLALEEQERKLADFRLRNDGQLPEQTPAITSAIGQLETKLGINRDQLESLALRRLILERETPAQEHETSTADRLQELRSNLLAMGAEFTDRHPDVVRLKAEISRLEETLADEPAPAPVDTQTRAGLALEAADREQERLLAERDTLLRDIGSYQRRLELVPRIEQQLIMLTRDYDNRRRSYESLLAKRIDAGLAENLEKRRQGEQFTILERAIPPWRPYFPNRLLMVAAGLGLGFAIGAGLALLREELVQTFSEARGLREAFPNVQVVAEIPWIEQVSNSGTQPDTRQEVGA